MKKLLITVLLLVACVATSYCQSVTMPKTWVASETIKAADLNGNFDFLLGQLYQIGSDNFDIGYQIPLSKIENGNLVEHHATRHTASGEDPFTATMTIRVNTIGTHTGAVIGSFTGDAVGSFTGHIYPTGTGTSEAATLGYLASWTASASTNIQTALTATYQTSSGSYIFGPLWTGGGVGLATATVATSGTYLVTYDCFVSANTATESTTVTFALYSGGTWFDNIHILGVSGQKGGVSSSRVFVATAPYSFATVVTPSGMTFDPTHYTLTASRITAVRIGN